MLAAGGASSAQPSQPGPEEYQRREARLLDAAATLLTRWGYRRTTLDDVARAAGVGKGRIYLHWRDKNDLFTAAIWRASQQVTDDTLQRMAADPEGANCIASGHIAYSRSSPIR